jgi:hypothetical protein
LFPPDFDRGVLPPPLLLETAPGLLICKPHHIHFNPVKINVSILSLNFIEFAEQTTIL